MHAVIETGGKQYRVVEGQKLKVERLNSDEGQEIEFDKILMVGEGDNVKLGSPYLDGGKVKATVVSNGRGKKVHIFKFRRRKNSKRQMGHRQDFTEIKIQSIEA